MYCAIMDCMVCVYASIPNGTLCYEDDIMYAWCISCAFSNLMLPSIAMLLMAIG
jgi:hypothetical protein